ncbi:MULTISPECIES: alanine racemase [Pontibacter]|uniref:D-serine deaminase, pyridoxal phosphate-dependent n=1 Tax=Pontibacter lucknowensis TaxID=1077936 RepID=A0A1N6ZFZ2_9BACT|nr:MULTISPECIES: alanine racemase [Pontibacter]EJF09403.1 alanine racemase [Pontibacter sp. BAB1700]SIR25820.1 D-serine deaminase, pyridoxal phosphate-dependent [Pontibacter lucknowensis]
MLNHITQTTLLLDEEKCRRNIAMMAEKAARNNIRLRPHFKTHQSAQVGEWFREAGTEAITVSSLKMARYFAMHGWKDIMVAIPVNIRDMALVNELAEKIKLHLVAVNIETVQALAKHLQHPVNLWLKIDTGYRRTGILPHSHEELDAIVALLEESERLQFTGVLAHDGHTYKQTDAEAIRTIHHTTVFLLNLVRDRYKARFPELQVSIGDTPSCSILQTITGVDEIRPGNFVFYDLTQQHIGSCSFEQIAVCMACPVIAKHPERNEIIVHGGSVHFSKDSLVGADGSLIFGRVVELTENSWSEPLEGIELVSLSQEHGTIRASKELFDKYKIGDLMGILPIHSCLTADAMGNYTTLDGKRLEHLSGIAK